MTLMYQFFLTAKLQIGLISTANLKCVFIRSILPLPLEKVIPKEETSFLWNSGTDLSPLFKIVPGLHKEV